MKNKFKILQLLALISVTALYASDTPSPADAPITEDENIEQALENAGLQEEAPADHHEEEQASAEHTTTPEAEHEASATEQAPMLTMATPEEHPAAPVIHEDAVSQTTTLVVPQEPAAPVVATTQIVQAAPIVPTAAPVIPATTTQVVKVYPVYEAVRSAMGHVYSAAQDMVNYVYSLFQQKESSQAPAVVTQENVTIQKNMA